METSEPLRVTRLTYWLLPRGMAILYCVTGAGMLGSHWWSALFDEKRPSFPDFLFPSLYLLGAGVYTFLTFRTYVRLSENSIEICRPRGTKVLPFEKIKGRRRYAEKADPDSNPKRHLVLEPNDDRYPRIDIRERKEFDEHFYRWFDSLPDLDKQDGIEEPKSKYQNSSLV